MYYTADWETLWHWAGSMDERRDEKCQERELKSHVIVYADRFAKRSWWHNFMHDTLCACCWNRILMFLMANRIGKLSSTNGKRTCERNCRNFYFSHNSNPIIVKSWCSILKMRICISFCERNLIKSIGCFEKCWHVIIYGKIALIFRSFHEEPADYGRPPS